MTRNPLGALTWPQTTRSAAAGSAAWPRSPYVVTTSSPPNTDR
ncbi:Uncharacterised protein [Mycobacteroides abscessus]|nr:Uncharacterised protein [Mycobacteroides abscessus]